jgi:hypothetical protein
MLLEQPVITLGAIDQTHPPAPDFLNDAVLADAGRHRSLLRGCHRLGRLCREPGRGLVGFQQFQHLLKHFGFIPKLVAQASFTLGLRPIECPVQQRQNSLLGFDIHDQEFAWVSLRIQALAIRHRR